MLALPSLIRAASVTRALGTAQTAQRSVDNSFDRLPELGDPASMRGEARIRTGGDHGQAQEAIKSTQKKSRDGTRQGTQGCEANCGESQAQTRASKESRAERAVASRSRSRNRRR